MKKLKRKIINLVKSIRNIITPVYQIIYYAKESGQKVEVLYIGWDKKIRYYWQERMQNNVNIHQKKSTFRFRGATIYLTRKKGAALVIAEQNMIKTPHSGFHPAFLLPKWMEMVIDIDTALVKNKTKEIIRRIRKHNLEYEFKNTMEDVDLFYFKMYKPLISQRHKGSAEIPNHTFFQDKFMSGKSKLLFISRNKKPIAAQFIEKLEYTYRIVSFGILDGNPEIQKMGVHAALYYFALKHFQELGYKTVLCGSSMPVAFDGVTQFKLRLGAKPYVKDIQHRAKYYLIPDLNNNYVFRIMHLNPLFHVSKDGLTLAVFLNADLFSGKEDFVKYYKKTRSENMHKTRFYISGNPEKIERWIQEENFKNIELLKYDKIVN